MFDFISFTILLLPTNFGIYMILILLSTSQHPKLKDVYIVSGLMSDKAILITGGWTEGSLQHPAELYLPHNGSGCSLPEIPERRKFHSQEAGLACGGSSRAYLEYTTRTAGGGAQDQGSGPSHTPSPWRGHSMCLGLQWQGFISSEVMGWPPTMQRGSQRMDQWRGHFL